MYCSDAPRLKGTWTHNASLMNVSHCVYLDDAVATLLTTCKMAGGYDIVKNSRKRKVHVLTKERKKKESTHQSSRKIGVRVWGVHSERRIYQNEPRRIWNFGILCCLTTPGLRKDIWRQIRQLYSHQVLYYIYYYYILSSLSRPRSHIYFYY